MSPLLLPDTFMGWPDLSKGESQTSELRGGRYAARVQEGYEKDGSPKYRYFKTAAEYEEYMSGKKGKKPKKDKKHGKGKGEDKDSLEQKQKEERKESKRQQRALFTEGKKKKKEVETTKKGLQLYIEVPQ